MFPSEGKDLAIDDGEETDHCYLEKLPKNYVAPALLLYFSREKGNCEYRVKRHQAGNQVLGLFLSIPSSTAEASHLRRR